MRIAEPRASQANVTHWLLFSQSTIREFRRCLLGSVPPATRRLPGGCPSSEKHTRDHSTSMCELPGTGGRMPARELGPLFRDPADDNRFARLLALSVTVRSSLLQLGVAIRASPMATYLGGHEPLAMRLIGRTCPKTRLALPCSHVGRLSRRDDGQIHTRPLSTPLPSDQPAAGIS